MDETQSKSVLLIFLLIGLIFIGIGLTIGIYSFPENIYEWIAVYGLPIEEPEEALLLLLIL
jgi:hypothetical protein